MWWASTYVTTEEGSDVIGKYFTANHYDFGYCYTWNYITENGTNRNGIICPEGWRLPTNKEHIALYKASGFTGSSQSTSAGYVANYNGSGNNGRWMGPGVANGGSDASKYPYTTDTHLFYPYAGMALRSNNVVGDSFVNSYELTWSSTPNSSSSALNLRMNNSLIQAYYSDPRTHSFNIRCVADAL